MLSSKWRRRRTVMRRRWKNTKDKLSMKRGEQGRWINLRSSKLYEINNIHFNVRLQRNIHAPIAHIAMDHSVGWNRAKTCQHSRHYYQRRYMATFAAANILDCGNWLQQMRTVCIRFKYWFWFGIMVVCDILIVSRICQKRAVVLLASRSAETFLVVFMCRFILQDPFVICSELRTWYSHICTFHPFASY